MVSAQLACMLQAQRLGASGTHSCPLCNLLRSCRGELGNKVTELRPQWEWHSAALALFAYASHWILEAEGRQMISVFGLLDSVILTGDLIYS